MFPFADPSPLFEAMNHLPFQNLRALHRRILVVLLLAWCLPVLAQTTQNPRRVAFVIGNAAYQNEQRLVNPHADAALIARTLREQLKFDEVVERRDLTRRQLVDLVAEVRTRGRKADAVVVYFSGHGMQGATGGNFLLPVDARIEQPDHVASEGLNAQLLVDALRQAEPRVGLLVLDACRNNPFSTRTRSATKGLQRLNTVTEGNLLVAYATTENQTADDGAPGNSPYAQALARYLAQTQLPLMAQLDRVRTMTSRLTADKQRPTREGDLPVHVRLIEGVLAEPPAPGGLELADLQREQQARSQWQAWQGRMQGDYDKLLSEGAGLAPDLRVQAWQRYLEAWKVDNPMGADDEALRAQAQQRLQEAQQAMRVAVAPSPRPAVQPEPIVPRAGQVLKDCDVCPELVVIGAGSFVMGSPVSEHGAGRSEGPQRRVEIRQAFALGQTEVTQAQWMAVMGTNPSLSQGCDDCPVESVSWNDVQEYIGKLNQRTGNRFGYRLPSEAEWEYAARAGTTTPFWTGQTITSGQANFDGNYTYNGSAKGQYRQRTTPVKTFGANPWGLHDMNGNVREWVQDVWHDSYVEGPTDGSAWMAGGNQRQRVLRGGSWEDNPQRLRSAYRGWYTPGIRNGSTGFRLARTVF
jgi:formylglycine-generating enzyme required for sulfatase activity